MDTLNLTYVRTVLSVLRTSEQDFTRVVGKEIPRKRRLQNIGPQYVAKKKSYRSILLCHYQGNKRINP